MVVPRDTLRHALPMAGDLHGFVLRGASGTGGLLADYMRALLGRADAIASADAPAIAQATTDMIAACFRSTAETVARAHAPIETTLLERIQRHIAANLVSSELDAGTLSRLFRISRTQLYRLFEPLGGVASYIQEQRLIRAHAELSNPAHDRRRIYDIAFTLGFSSESHFSRVFRSMFGLSPSDVRARARAEPAGIDRRTPRASAESKYEDWVRQLQSARALRASS